MKKVIYAGLLIGLTAASTEGFAEVPSATLKATVTQLKSSIAGAKASYGSGSPLFGTLFANVQKMVTDMSTISQSVDTTSQQVESQLPTEYTSIQTTATTLEDQLTTFSKTDCYANSVVCNTTIPAVNQYLSELPAAITAYQKAIAGLPSQTEISSGVAVVQKAIDSLDAQDKAQLTTLTTDINNSQTALQTAINQIDGIISNIESASTPGQQ